MGVRPLCFAPLLHFRVDLRINKVLNVCAALGKAIMCLRLEYSKDYVGVCSGGLKPSLGDSNLERHSDTWYHKILVSRSICWVQLSSRAANIDGLSPSAIGHGHQPLLVVDSSLVLLDSLENSRALGRTN